MHKLQLPRLGQTMEEAELTSWLVGSGAAFAAGDLVYEVETEKVTTGVEATRPGTVVRMLVQDGSRVEVGAVLAVVADPGEQPSEAEIDAFLASEVGGGPASASSLHEAVDETVAAGVADDGPVRAMPRTRALARELGVPLEDISRTRPGSLVTEADVRAAAAAPPGPPPPVAGPPVAARADSDVAAPTSRTVSAPASRPPQENASIAVRERRRLGPVQRRMADVTARSWAVVPQFSQSVEVDASTWAARRDEVRQASGTDFGYTDLVVSCVVRAVQDVPEVNASYVGDDLIIYRDVNLSLAVDSPAGLQVPVLHRLQDLSDSGRARLLRERAEKARDGQLGLDDVQGGTITLSNLGMFGIEGGMPMVTAPQACIVFVGAVTRRVVPVGDGIAVRPMCTVVNSFDHRALDGATAARFTAALRRHLQGEARP